MEKELAMEEEAKLQPKPLSENAFVAFFQKIARWWLGGWYGFTEKHKKLADLAYKIFFFFVFSMGVTIWQYLVMTFLPYAFAGLAEIEFVWPAVDFKLGGETFTYAIFNEPTKYLESGAVDPCSGLGNFIAFEIAVFTAQCINFPLQRNITFRSHGNPWYQAMWYFIGWVGVSIFTSALWGIVSPFLSYWGWPAAVANLVKTFITGGVSMIIFFFVFLVIFPDVNKMLASKTKKMEAAKSALEEAKASGDAGRIASAQAAYDKAFLAYTIADENKRRFDAEKGMASAKSLAESKIIGYQSMKSHAAKAEAAGKTEEAAEFNQAAAKFRAEALEAIAERDKIVPEGEEVVRQILAARAARKAQQA